ncbi:Golgi organization protein 2 homolog [Seminavis robusta]|uniref:Golgi organization protein 2 homolog n=1 Tax=Seminavis robusta TaxID=568900 RepID=A0A9N8HHA8_9STRA|nr:Golgi organization protein 2 homolog [Seminavis robusta]|eukprot:Sro625_g177490.1 Golgi organization protein 2 homolog (330) ;mRNA; f:8695-9684
MPLSAQKDLLDDCRPMCLILFIHQPATSNSKYSLVVAANRDEVYSRPTERVHYWPTSQTCRSTNDDEILAGKDLEAGGMWMGITSKQGRFAAVTNFREPRRDEQDAQARPSHATRKSRGDLVSDFLTSNVSPLKYLEAIEADQTCFYSGFNLLVGDASDGLYCYSNRSNDGNGNSLIQGNIQKLESGRVYALCNRFLDYPWPKVIRAKQRFSAVLENAISDDNSSSKILSTSESDQEMELRTKLFEVLKDSTKAPDKDVPHKDTGCPEAFEKMVSSPFMESDWYGTRACSVLLVGNNKNNNNNHHSSSFVERSFGPHGEFQGEVHETWG